MSCYLKQQSILMFFLQLIPFYCFIHFVMLYNVSRCNIIIIIHSYECKSVDDKILNKNDKKKKKKKEPNEKEKKQYQRLQQKHLYLSHTEYIPWSIQRKTKNKIKTEMQCKHEYTSKLKQIICQKNTQKYFTFAMVCTSTPYKFFDKLNVYLYILYYAIHRNIRWMRAHL